MRREPDVDSDGGFLLARADVAAKRPGLLMRSSREVAGREAAGERLLKLGMAAKKRIRKPGAFELRRAV
jgi:hypothetical protein